MFGAQREVVEPWGVCRLPLKGESGMFCDLEASGRYSLCFWVPQSLAGWDGPRLVCGIVRV